MDETNMNVTASWTGGGGGRSVLVHGGAGDVAHARLAVHEAGCRHAAEAGYAVLAQGGSALDAVERAVSILEDNPCFNAGTGACLTREAQLELDASLMEGGALRAGGICALPPFKNPIQIARAVLEDGEHVLYAAEGAAAFARARGFETADAEHMITQSARDKLAQALASGKAASWAGGTVGAVARDHSGCVAAATSTGGTAGKRSGRVGDSPLIGAGTYADNAGGAASATGHGEGIMRIALAHGAVARLAAGMDPLAVSHAVILELARRVGSTAGVILVSADGTLGLARSTNTMTWAAAWEGAAPISGH
jgi:beta-aspartyl-peptidase (threonine type)